MRYIKRYCGKILGEEIPSCEEQKLLCRMVLRILESEDIRIDEVKVDKYFGLQKYFPFGLFDWEKFLFVLHACAYKADGTLRFPDAFVYVGRGSGKNGFASFESFALLSPVNGIRHYNVQSFAAGEDNAKRSFDEVRQDVLDGHPEKLKRFFRWTKETISCTKTASDWTFHTSAPKTKDGFRPGLVHIDEIHTYQNSRLISVAAGGLGKVADPRVLITTTDGYVRDGPLDAYKKRGRDILDGEIPDNGFLPFICHCLPHEINDPENWIKAIPSLDQFPVLRTQVAKDFAEYERDPVANDETARKRFNCDTGMDEGSLTSWDNIQACCSGPRPRDIPELAGYPCVFGVDYSEINDFMSAVIITLMGGVYYWDQHTWVCRKSHDLGRIVFPLDDAVREGDAEYVDDETIRPELPFLWLRERTRGRTVLAGASDSYKYSYLRAECEDIMRFKAGARKAENKYGAARGWFYFNRPSNLAQCADTIISALDNKKIQCGDSKLMRWYFGNIKKDSKKGYVQFLKVEQKSRKTDGAHAGFAGMTLYEMLMPYDRPKKREFKAPQVWTF